MNVRASFFTSPLQSRLFRHRSAAASIGTALTLLVPSIASAQGPQKVSAEGSATTFAVLSGAGQQASPTLLAAARPIAFASPEGVDRTAELPDAPSASKSSESSSLGNDAASFADPAAADETKAGRKYPRAASPTDITVLPGQTAPRQTVRDKLVGSVRDSVSPFSFAGELISAGYSQATNGSPNYGTDAKAFAQRFGASVARGTSQNLFYEGAMASILHEDPRYYQMGSGHFFLKRLVYAGTRPLITRTDSGKSTPNLALLTGYLGAAALTKVYYPPLNQGFNQTLQTYGGSVGGAALGYVVSEFLSDTLQLVHLKKAE